ncbi:MAG: tetratricopeptide repeat protein [bacterium]|jgi:tetratricopeptide (TPR) repeat protein
MRNPTAALLVAASIALAADAPREARDRQDRAALERIVAELEAEAQKRPGDAGAHYRLAQAESYVAEVALEQGDKNAARAAAEKGIAAAERAVKLAPGVAEHHRVLGTLCGQVIPAQVLLAVKYGRCARESIEKAIELDPKSALAWLGRGVGNYYLPEAFGGGVNKALSDFDKAIALDPKSADARLWKGIALRKAGRNAEARKEIAKSLELNPGRLWAKQQLEKTPAE